MRHAISQATTAVLVIGLSLFLVLGVIRVLPTEAHHVAIAESDSDHDAFVSAIVEYSEQHTAVLEAFRLWRDAPSGQESLTALNALESTIEVTITHLEGLDVRECFALWHEAAVREFTTLADDIALARSGGTPTYALPGAYYNLVNNVAFIDLMECQP